MMRSKSKTPLTLGVLLSLALFGCSHGGGSQMMHEDTMEGSMSSSEATMKSDGMLDTIQGSMDGMKKEDRMSPEPMSGDSMDDGGMQKPMDSMKKEGM